VPDHRTTIETLFSRLNGGDVGVLDDVFHDDAVIDWPQFGERIRGAENRRSIYANMPRLPAITTRRIFGEGDLWIAEATLDYGDGGTFEAIFVFELRGDRIARETAYWALPSPPAEWRASWVEPVE